MKQNKDIICITGIDTDIGKTVATGLLAKYLQSIGKTVITQKIAQTGCETVSEDILMHRDIMGRGTLTEDKNNLTCPYVFPTPCSPHLAASIENESIDEKKILDISRKLQDKYDHVLLEGAGGLMVPLRKNLLFIDYIKQCGYPVILVSSPRLGSINHTLSAMELLNNRGIEINGIIYNKFLSENIDKRIVNDSEEIIKKYLGKFGFKKNVIPMYELDYYKYDNDLDSFGVLFE